MIFKKFRLKTKQTNKSKVLKNMTWSKKRRKRCTYKFKTTNLQLL